ncbi:MAG: hypothetical protein Q8S21_03785 [Candidatus Paracaedibacteraceae bacterium]|nr:hypothetical protein [Candidatus Paracaedibacteraceae bacterium]
MNLIFKMMAFVFCIISLSIKVNSLEDAHEMWQHETPKLNHGTMLGAQNDRLNVHSNTLNEHATDIANLAATVDEHTAALPTFASAAALNNITNTVNGHTTTLANHGNTLVNHWGMLNVQSDRLDVHDNTLNEYATDIANLAATVDEHTAALPSFASTAALNSVAGTVDGHTTTLANHDCMLFAHTRGFNEQEDMLTDCNNRLAGHDTQLAVLGLHTEQLTNLNNKLGEQSNTVNEIKVSNAHYCTKVANMYKYFNEESQIMRQEIDSLKKEISNNSSNGTNKTH